MDLDMDEWDRVMRVNVRGVWQCVKSSVPAMERRGGGAIVNIATNRVFSGFPNLLHYDASKGAVLAMTKAMAAELGPRNIRVNAVAPGLTLSENVLAKPGIAEREKAVVAGRALGRSQQPEDLIGAVCFFAGEMSGFVSGQSLIVDGGGIMQ
jgi:NAD(P)-dependent dehydrogenase (short-subunit alcohol dehydrogenase family)